MRSLSSGAVLRRRTLATLAAGVLAVGTLSACGSDGGDDASDDPTYTSTPSDTFPVTVEHQYGETTIPEEPKRVVVVGLTEQDILLELGVIPVATTEWYGEQPQATWPWAHDLLDGYEPTVLDQTDGVDFEKVASLEPDLIVGTNAGLTEEDYERLTEIAPTVTSVAGSELYFSSWQDQVRQVAAAVGRSAEGEDLITEVADLYAEAAAANPEFAGLTATFSQGGAWENNLYVYPDGLNTDFLTDLGFTITPGLEEYVGPDGGQALISAENTGLLEADVIVFATEEPDAVEPLLDFGTIRDLAAVRENRSIYTDGILAGAIYFLTPLSQKYVLEQLVPRLQAAVAGRAPQDVEG